MSGCKLIARHLGVDELKAVLCDKVKNKTLSLQITKVCNIQR